MNKKKQFWINRWIVSFKMKAFTKKYIIKHSFIKDGTSYCIGETQVSRNFVVINKNTATIVAKYKLKDEILDSKGNYCGNIIVEIRKIDIIGGCQNIGIINKYDGIMQPAEYVRVYNP